jgi:hypothetical protein
MYIYRLELHFVPSVVEIFGCASRSNVSIALTNVFRAHYLGDHAQMESLLHLPHQRQRLCSHALEVIRRGTRFVRTTTRKLGSSGLYRLMMENNCWAIPLNMALQ